MGIGELARDSSFRADPRASWNVWILVQSRVEISQTFLEECVATPKASRGKTVQINLPFSHPSNQIRSRQARARKRDPGAHEQQFPKAAIPHKVVTASRQSTIGRFPV
jgi:hypothetical protein